MRTRVPLAAGTVLGRYRILRLAGEGGMGDVYEAFDDSLERIVALKRVRGGPAEDNRLERFRREALALAQLNHPGICQVFELAQTDRGAFIAMEWVEGRTLSDRLLDGPLPWREAAAVLRQIAEALAAAHAKGIVHRDLKPGNVMLTSGGQAKVLDFGLARFAESPEEAPPITGETPRLEAPAGPDTALDPSLDPGDAETLAAPPRPSGPHTPRSGSGRSLTLVGSFMGTLGYASPEQALARTVGPPTDVFNLGLLAQELVTAQRPFPGQGKDALDAVVDGRRQPLPRALAPKPYRALVDRLLAPKSQDRPTAEEAAAAFAALVAPKGALWWSGVGAASVAVLAFSGYWLFGRGVLAGLVKGRPARVAVMGFRNDTGQPMLDAQTRLGLADLISSRLRAEQKLQLIGPDALAQAAQALHVDPAAAGAGDQLRLARAVGADLILSGAVDRRNGRDHLAYRLWDASGRTRTQGEAEAGTLSQTILEAIPLAQAAGDSILKAVDPLGKTKRLEPYRISPEAFAEYAKGVDAYRRGHYLEAEPMLAKVAYATPEWTEAVAAYAVTLSALSRPEADATLRWALVCARKEGKTSSESSVTRALGIMADKRRDFEAERAYFEQGIALSRAQGDLRGVSLCLNGLGRFAETQGDFASASAHYTEALDATDRDGDQIMRTQILTNLGNLALRQGDLGAAIKRYGAAVETARGINDEAGEALGLNNLGIALSSQFQTVEARRALERALALRERGGDQRGIASTCRNLGVIALIEGQPVEAAPWFQRARGEAAAISDPYREGQALFFLAECERLRGSLGPALKLYQAAKERSLAGKDVHQAGLITAAEAECLFRTKRHAQGVAALEDAARLVPGNPYLLRAQAWRAIDEGERAEAQAFIRQALDDPQHDAPELRPELRQLLRRSQDGSGIPSPQPQPSH